MLLNLPLEKNSSHPSPRLSSLGEIPLESHNSESGNPHLLGGSTTPKRLNSMLRGTSQSPTSFSSAGSHRSSYNRTRTKTVGNRPSRFKQFQSSALVLGNAGWGGAPGVNVISPDSPEDRIRKILSTPKRTQEDAVFIYRQVQDFDFFKKFKESNTDLHQTDSLIHICKHLGYEKYKAGSILMKEGDEPNGRLYLIFSGEVSVIIKNLDFITQQNMNVNRLNQLNAPVQEDMHVSHYEEGDSVVIREPTDEFSKIFGKRGAKEDEKDGMAPLEFWREYKENSNLTRGAKLWKKVLFVVRLAIGSWKAKNSTVTSLASPSPIKDVLDQKDLLSPDSKMMLTSSPPRFEIRNHLNPLIIDKRDRDLMDRSKYSITSIDTNNVDTPLRSPGKDNNKQKSFFFNFSPVPPAGESGKEMMQPVNAFRLNQFEEEKVSIDKIAAKYGNVINKIGKGTFFGEKALYSRQKRSATIMANTDCEFLTVSEELFNYIKSRFEKTNIKKLNFLLDNFPAIEKTKNKFFLESLLYLLEEKTFEMHNALTVEGNKDKNFYVLYEGVCNVYKKLPGNEPEVAKLRQYGDQEGSSKSDGLLVCKIFPGTFIGEEVVFNGINQYEYTVRAASSDVMVMAIDRANFAVRFPNHVFFALKKMYQKKAKHYTTISLERAKLKSDIIHLARQPRKKKVNLIPGEVLAGAAPKFIVSSLRGPLDSHQEEVLHRLKLAKRVVPPAALSSKPMPSARQKEVVQHILPLSEGISLAPSPRSITNTTQSPKATAEIVVVKYKGNEGKTVNKVHNITKIKFDFGEHDGHSLEERRAQTSRKNLNAKNGGSQVSLNLVSISKERELLKLKRVTTADADIIGNGLLKRIQKGRAKSKKYVDVMYAPVTNPENSRASTSRQYNLGIRVKSEPNIFDERRFSQLNNLIDSPKSGVEGSQSKVKGIITGVHAHCLSDLKLAKDLRKKTVDEMPCTTGSVPTRRRLSTKSIPKSEITRINEHFKTDRSIEHGMMIDKHDFESHMNVNTRTVTVAESQSGGKSPLRKAFMSLGHVSLEAGFFSGLPNIDMRTPPVTSRK